MIAAKELNIVLIHGRCFRTCYVLKLLSTITHSRCTRARARTKTRTHAPECMVNTCGAELLCNS